MERKIDCNELVTLAEALCLRLLHSKIQAVAITQVYPNKDSLAQIFANAEVGENRQCLNCILRLLYSELADD